MQNHSYKSNACILSHVSEPSAHRGMGHLVPLKPLPLPLPLAPQVRDQICKIHASNLPSSDTINLDRAKESRLACSGLPSFCDSPALVGHCIVQGWRVRSPPSENESIYRDAGGLRHCNFDVRVQGRIDSHRIACAASGVGFDPLLLKSLSEICDTNFLPNIT